MEATSLVGKEISDSDIMTGNSEVQQQTPHNRVGTIMLYGIPIVSLYIDGKERLCLAQISNTLLKEYSYNEIHNRRVALGITCVQCTPVQLEILRRAGAMPISSRRCGMISKREAERLVKSFLEDTSPPKLPENFTFEVQHECGWGCKGSFMPSRYNSSRAKCIRCAYCSLFFSPNKFIFHFHRNESSKYHHPDAANFNSWRRHLRLDGANPPDDLMHAWEDVKAMFNGGSRKRLLSSVSGKPVKEPGEVEVKRRKPEGPENPVWRPGGSPTSGFPTSIPSNPFLPPFMQQTPHPAFVNPHTHPSEYPQAAKHCLWKGVPNPYMNPYGFTWNNSGPGSYPSTEFNPAAIKASLEYKDKNPPPPLSWPPTSSRKDTRPTAIPFHLDCTDVGQCFSAFTPVGKENPQWLRIYQNYRQAWGMVNKNNDKLEAPVLELEKSPSEPDQPDVTDSDSDHGSLTHSPNGQGQESFWKPEVESEKVVYEHRSPRIEVSSPGLVNENQKPVHTVEEVEIQKTEKEQEVSLNSFISG